MAPCPQGVTLRAYAEMKGDNMTTPTNPWGKHSTAHDKYERKWAPQFKGVAYAYPTSPQAKDRGAYKTGCYFVYTRATRLDKTRAQPAPFTMLRAARQHAESIAGEWDRLSM